MMLGDPQVNTPSVSVPGTRLHVCCCHTMASSLSAKRNSVIYIIQISAGLPNVGHGISSHFDGDELKDNLIPHHTHARMANNTTMSRG